MKRAVILLFVAALIFAAIVALPSFKKLPQEPEESEPQTMLHYGDDYPWASRYPMKLLS